MSETLSAPHAGEVQATGIPSGFHHQWGIRWHSHLEELLVLCLLCEPVVHCWEFA